MQLFLLTFLILSFLNLQNLLANNTSLVKSQNFLPKTLRPESFYSSTTNFQKLQPNSFNMNSANSYILAMQNNLHKITPEQREDVLQNKKAKEEHFPTNSLQVTQNNQQGPNLLQQENNQNLNNKLPQKSLEKPSSITFYSGSNPQINSSQLAIDKSVEQVNRSSKNFYGAKINSGGFFIAPEIFNSTILNSTISDSSTQNNSSQNRDLSSQNQNSNQQLLQANSYSSYSFKANIGYDFNQYFSTFLTYDVANLSVSQSQAAINRNNFSNYNFSFGSQINFSGNFGVKITCSNSQYNNFLNQQNAISGCNNLKIGTIYGF